MEGKLNIRDQDRLVDLVIEGYHSLEELQHKFGISQQELINIVKAELPADDYEAWRKEVG